MPGVEGEVEATLKRAPALMQAYHAKADSAIDLASVDPQHRHRRHAGGRGQHNREVAALVASGVQTMGPSSRRRRPSS